METHRTATVRKLHHCSWVFFAQDDKRPTCSTPPPRPHPSYPGKVGERSGNEVLADHCDEGAGPLCGGRRHLSLYPRKGRREEEGAGKHADKGIRIRTGWRTGRSQPEREDSPDGKASIKFWEVTTQTPSSFCSVGSSVKFLWLTNAAVAGGHVPHRPWHRTKQRDHRGRADFCVPSVRGIKWPVSHRMQRASNTQQALGESSLDLQVSPGT